MRPNVPDHTEDKTGNDAELAGAGGAEITEVNKSRHDFFLGKLCKLNKLRGTEHFGPNRSPGWGFLEGLLNSDFWPNPISPSCVDEPKNAGPGCEVEHRGAGVRQVPIDDLNNSQGCSAWGWTYPESKFLGVDDVIFESDEDWNRRLLGPAAAVGWRRLIFSPKFGKIRHSIPRQEILYVIGRLLHLRPLAAHTDCWKINVRN